MLPRPIGNRPASQARSAAKTALETLHLMRGLDRAPPDTSRETGPMASAAARASAGACAFQRMQTAYPDYRMRQRSIQLKRTLGGLRDLGRDREKRIEGVLRPRAFMAYGCTSAGAPTPEPA